MTEDRPLLRYFPRLTASVSFAEVGSFPTPIQPADALADTAVAAHAFVKRDDLTAPSYGGNKVRTLEVLFGSALREGRSQVYSTGAYGSNHAFAALIHGPPLGLQAGAMLYPQPYSATAADNLVRVAVRARPFIPVRHWAHLPYAIWRQRRLEPRAMVMPPGGAIPLGALGYVSAALELAEQIKAGELPEPARIVVGVGSTCTTAGLLVGLRAARLRGLAFSRRMPTVVAVRVTPWPVTSPLRIAYLARQTSQLLAKLSGDPRLNFEFSELRAGLRVDARFIGSGYGKITDTGLAAVARFGQFGRRTLDSTYAAKAAAGFLQSLAEVQAPTLFWATKSSAPLPELSSQERVAIPKSLVGWLAQAELGAR